MGTQVLIKSEGPHLFKEALIDKTQTGCRQTQQHDRKMATFPGKTKIEVIWLKE